MSFHSLAVFLLTPSVICTFRRHPTNSPSSSTSLRQQRHRTTLILTTYLLFHVFGNIQFRKVQNAENTHNAEHVCLCDDYIAREAVDKFLRGRVVAETAAHFVTRGLRRSGAGQGHSGMAFCNVQQVVGRIIRLLLLCIWLAFAAWKVRTRYEYGSCVRG